MIFFKRWLIGGMSVWFLQAAWGVPDALPSVKLLRQAFGAADEKAFADPPAVFHPETWFHFIGGNVSTNGITADLEAIQAAGISGVQLFHGQFGGAWPGVDPQITCLSGAWDAAVRHAAETCRRLDLRFSMQNCPGWAMAGGPWIAPSNAMRRLVWSRSDVTGGVGGVALALPRPQPSGDAWRDYREVAVLAFPTPEEDTGDALIPSDVRSNREHLPWRACLNGEPGAKLVLEEEPEAAWVEVSFDRAVSVRTIECSSVQAMNHAWCYKPGVTVTVQALSSEGTQVVAQVEMPQSSWQDNRPISLACSERSAQTYRVVIRHAHPLTLTSLRFYTAARQNNWEAEAAWTLRALDRRPYPAQSSASWVRREAVTNLTDRMDAQGSLIWDPPPGKWTVLRIGHVNAGEKNGPAPAEATGWECDKLAPSGADAHFAGYIGRLCGKQGPLKEGLLSGLLLDSWECRTQTWTPGMETRFLAARGYPLRSWLPALTGYTVGDPETTACFLRDWRTTLSDLITDNFFGRMSELGHANGLSVSFETAFGDVLPGDILTYYKYADVPMCEFWQPRSEAFVGCLDFKPVRPCVSAARMYGKPRVAAEAFTSFQLTWAERLSMLKDIANLHLAAGVTHLVFHTYTHNPLAAGGGLPPGTSFGASIGTPFLRGQTGWSAMPDFTAYLARCGYLLERGWPVSDVLLYVGDETDHKPDQELPFPDGYAYDYCNPDALLTRLSVRDGRLVTPEGIAYRLLWLRECPRLTPETLEKMLALVEKGATIVGERPAGVATLSGGEKAAKRFRQAADALWGEEGKDLAKGVRHVGRGRVIAGLPLTGALGYLGIEPDVRGAKQVLWAHRRTEDADWYFVAAPTGQAFKGELGFRSAGEAECWNPVSGRRSLFADVRREGAYTWISLTLAEAESVFVVFRKAARQGLAFSYATTNAPVAQIAVKGPWTLAFPPGWDAPANVRVDALQSWTELELPPAARAFSGTATYTTTFEMPPFIQPARVELDLGRVEMIARVRLNEKNAGLAWAPPFRLDVSESITSGVNRLEVEVTNPWHNRLAYDAGLPETERKTWTLNGPKKDAALVPAGLLGPVSVTVWQSLATGDKKQP